MRTFLLESMKQVRNGNLGAVEGRAIADISKQVIDSARLDLEYAERTNSKVVNPMEIGADSQPEAIEHESKEPDIKLIMSYYEDNTKPSQIATLTGLDVKTVTQTINDNKHMIG